MAVLLYQAGQPVANIFLWKILFVLFAKLIGATTLPSATNS